MRDIIILALLFIVGAQLLIFDHHAQPEPEPMQPSSLILITNGWLNIGGNWIYIAEDAESGADACMTMIHNGYDDYSIVSWEQVRNGVIVENFPRRGL